MFTCNADFKGISEEPELIPPLHVDSVLQKAFIEVNEEGTIASALTSKSNIVFSFAIYFV